MNQQRTEQLQYMQRKIDEINRSTSSRVDIPKLPILHTNLSGMASTGSDIWIEQAILQSLRFREIQVRFHKIPEAHARTFGWIFGRPAPSQNPELCRNSCVGTLPNVKFIDWLEDSTPQTSLYWIAGKAGAGKSTLMKFLSDHEETKRALASWAGSNPLVIASYFFWCFGTQLQKSQEGLLQTLLYEICRQCPHLIRSCCPWRMGPLARDAWSLSELRKALHNLKTGLVESTKFFVFVDGLDEYDGDTREIVEAIEDLSSLPNIKLCVSSRPWTIFREKFGQDQDRHLFVQDLTKGDINLYVRNTFEADSNFLQAKVEDEKYEDLVTDIVIKAEGVFLWVILVVKSLLNGLTNEDSLRAMHDRLNRLPADLEDFFHHMLKSVEPVYQEKMARTFQVAIAGDGPLPVLVYSHLDDIEECPDYALRLALYPIVRTTGVCSPETEAMFMTDFKKGERQMQKRLDARTKGLLEVVRETTNRNELVNKVSFLHRTVGDFVKREEIMSEFTKITGSTFNVNVMLCHALLATIKALPGISDGRFILTILNDLVHPLLDHAYSEEIGQRAAQIEVIDELERSLTYYHPIHFPVSLVLGVPISLGEVLNSEGSKSLID
ncbi:hypothetical protein BT63DRAFT_219596 [Microthyrium microscopicum]|uniref:NACHT domain-containing protein n=1 Tax=Microthyrium microscopicum TaxID=703497 RepID=A0A6A6UGW6_9PEZI|nr:hypothetical protein BT63DRAFT_219596 [Microthyrium microscopicum]